MEVEFALVDVFAEAPLTGNGLAVVPDAEDLDDATMRAVARECNQSAPAYGPEVGDRAALAAALGLTESDLADRPAQVVSTGAGHLLVPVVDRATVDRVAVDTPALQARLADAGGEGCYVYTTDGADARAYARFFNPTMGIVEDPATSTAAGPLAAQLVRLGDADPGEPVLIRQGDATGRPSLIRIDVTGTDVTISGTGLVVGAGRLRVA